MWTPTALASELRSYSGKVWRVVEAQHRISTNRLADSLEDQARLEALAEALSEDVTITLEGEKRHRRSRSWPWDGPTSTDQNT
mgnify:CR=1 FL=1